MTTETNTPMGTNWMVCVDDTVAAGYAFDYATRYMKKDLDQLYLINVSTTPWRYGYYPFGSAETIQSMKDYEEKKSKKILVHYGNKAKQQGLKATMMNGTDNDPAALICRTIKNYNITHCVTGRRVLGFLERTVVGSCSRNLLENAECNVVVVKSPVSDEEDDEMAKVIQEEKEERLQNEKEEGSEPHKDAMEEEELALHTEAAKQKHKTLPAEETTLRDERVEGRVQLEKIHAMEEVERARRIEEQKKLPAEEKQERKVRLYQLQEEVKQQAK